MIGVCHANAIGHHPLCHQIREHRHILVTNSFIVCRKDRNVYLVLINEIKQVIYDWKYDFFSPKITFVTNILFSNIFSCAAGLFEYSHCLALRGASLIMGNSLKFSGPYKEQWTGSFPAGNYLALITTNFYPRLNGHIVEGALRMNFSEFESKHKICLSRKYIKRLRDIVRFYSSIDCHNSFWCYAMDV